MESKNSNETSRTSELTKRDTPRTTSTENESDTSSMPNVHEVGEVRRPPRSMEHPEMDEDEFFEAENNSFDDDDGLAFVNENNVSNESIDFSIFMPYCFMIVLMFIQAVIFLLLPWNSGRWTEDVYV